ncbi:MAG: S-methyl-5-thioribose-1-phosphate isomerase [Oscillospiraceae bacterium]|nr:S-methyl-5-thioribose-1-phosphate isomerase [Oscillospiraceae bacterium]
MNLFEEVQPVTYSEGEVYFLDQRALPEETIWLKIDTLEKCYDAIKTLAIRGAPAIGIGAAFGMMAIAKNAPDSSFDEFYSYMKNAKEYLERSRPTAVNLSWALNRVNDIILKYKDKPIKEIKDKIEEEAILIQEEDEEVCRKIGENGQQFIKEGMGILTHCNAGALATSKYGTALAPIYVAKERGINVHVFADETRPLLQGARLTCYELYKSGIDVTLITDNMAAVIMKKGWIDACFVGCDRLAQNGDAANKIGTYGLALLAKAHNIPFYVACPISTIDIKTKTGDDIPIEERDGSEITEVMGKKIAPLGIKTFNPAFDVTPNELISGIITERGVIRAPYDLRKAVEALNAGKGKKHDLIQVE